jgi:ribokinase
MVKPAKRNLLVIGSSNIDQIIFSETLPVPGETVADGRYAQVFGGKGANQAVAAAKAGGNITMVSSVGDDAFGTQIRENLASFGIDTRSVKTQSGEHTGVALILVDAKGENCISVALGANLSLHPGMVAEVLEDADSGFALALLQMEAPVETVTESIRLLHERKIPVMLNLAPFGHLPDETLSKVYCLVLNAGEAEALSGCLVKNVESAVLAAEAIQKRVGIPLILVTLGKDGVVLKSVDNQTHFPAYVVEVVDTTAAGDVFCGYLAAGMAEGKLIAETIQFSVAASALSVMKAGAQTSVPAREEVELFLERNG